LLSPVQEVLMAAGEIHAHEADSDVGLVRRLLAAQFPQWAARPIERVPSAGTDHALYRLGDDQVVRLPLAWRAAKGLDKELTWLPRLAPLLPVAIPVVLGTGLPAEGYPLPWAVYRWLDGENPRIDHIADTDVLATDLAAFIAALQRVDLADGPAAYRGGPLATQDAGTRAALADLGGMVDTEVATAVWDAALRAPEWSDPPVWVHADLMPGNVLVRQGRLTAVLDFSTVGVGDPACDLIVGWFLLPAPAREAFRAAVHVDDATWARGRGWALALALGQVAYFRDTNPVIVADARQVIRAVLTDHLPHLQRSNSNQTP
jgi:aminoglycoside phosphotransferase (APT) family kinase protein